LFEKSYAVWLQRQSLSSRRIWSRIEWLILAPKIYRWLRDIASQTKTIGDVSKFVANLERLQQIDALAKPIKLAASESAEAFRKRDIPPLNVVQHSDLTKDNILKASTNMGFIVVDWAGAKINGAPYFDLVKFSLSVGASATTLRREIAIHSRLLDCDERHALAYVLSGLGALHLELEHFPEDRFVKLCEAKFFTLQRL
jgi:thiamine kinase-like enzyme